MATAATAAALGAGPASAAPLTADTMPGGGLHTLTDMYGTQGFVWADPANKPIGFIQMGHSAGFRQVGGPVTIHDFEGKPFAKSVVTKAAGGADAVLSGPATLVNGGATAKFNPTIALRDGTIKRVTGFAKVSELDMGAKVCFSGQAPLAGETPAEHVYCGSIDELPAAGTNCGEQGNAWGGFPRSKCLIRLQQLPGYQTDRHGDSGSAAWLDNGDGTVKLVGIDSATDSSGKTAWIESIDAITAAFGGKPYVESTSCGLDLFCWLRQLLGLSAGQVAAPGQLTEFPAEAGVPVEVARQLDAFNAGK
ncbi:hypothetical protein ACWEVD_15030 [Nocardia thailandica]